MVNSPPNLFIAGAPRSGTSALCLYLKQHPDIHLSILKEPHYYATDLMQQPHTVTDKNDYLGLFSNAPINAEGSVWYLISQHAASAIKAEIPNAKIIILLRRPWDQIHSLHSLYLRTGNETEADLSKAITLCQSRSLGENLASSSYFHDGLQYLDNATYSPLVKRFQSIFAEQLKVILFDDFIAQPQKVMMAIFHFLGIDENVEIEFDQRQATLNLRNEVLAQLRKQPISIRQKFTRNFAQVQASDKKSIFTAELKQQLMDYFKADVAHLSQLLNRDLTELWYQ